MRRGQRPGAHRVAFSDLPGVLGPVNSAAFDQSIAGRLWLIGRPINVSGRRVDMTNMPGLLAKLTDRFRDADQHRDLARHCLEHIARVDGSAELEITRAMTSAAGVMRARVYEVGDDSFLIGPPRVADATQQLVRNEVLRLTISDKDQLLCGDTRVLGRARFEHEGKRVYGYRLALPEHLAGPKQRSTPAVTAAPRTRHYVVEAELRCLKREIPVRGIITALTEKMVHMRSMNAPDDLRDGDRMSFHAELPHPLGAVEQTVRVSSVQPVGAREMTMIGLTFVAPMHEARALLDGGPIRWG